MLFHRFSYFVSIFIRVFSFVYISDRFARYSRDSSQFYFACFLVFIGVYIYLDCAAKLVLFCVGFSCEKEPQKGETRGVSV